MLDFVCNSIVHGREWLSLFTLFIIGLSRKFCSDILLKTKFYQDFIEIDMKILSDNNICWIKQKKIVFYEVWPFCLFGHFSFIPLCWYSIFKFLELEFLSQTSYFHFSRISCWSVKFWNSSNMKKANINQPLV